MKLKVCGMKYQDNIQAVANLEPDYIGFIFHESSKRNIENRIPVFSNSIKILRLVYNCHGRKVLWTNYP